MSQLTETINDIVPLTNEERDMIENAYKTIVVSKGELWVEQGKRCEQVGFLESGKLWFYYIDDDGIDVTCYFSTAGEFLSSFTSFLTNSPAKENVEAIEDSVMRVINSQELETLSEKVPKMNVFRRINAENLFITMEKRVFMLQSQTAFERYEKMLKESPEIVHSVPLHYTASFLGITPQHLSRIRKEMTR